MKSNYLLSALIVTVAGVQAGEIGGSDGTPSVDGTMFTFKSGPDGEGVAVGPKGVNAWASSATNNTCVPKGAEGLQSVIASSPALDVREDRTYCVLGFTSDNCIGDTVVGKEYQAPVVRLMDEDAPPTWTYNFETDISSAQVVSGACPMVAGNQTSSANQSATESQESSNTAIADQKPSGTQATDPAQSSKAQAADPQQSSNAQRAIPFMQPLLLYIVFVACKLF